MAEDWEGIRAEASAALGGLGLEITLIKSGAQETPWAPAGAASTQTFAALDKGIKHRFDKAANGEMVPRVVRVVTLEAGDGLVPEVGDQVLIKGMKHTVRMVGTVAPSTLTLLYRLELAAEGVAE